MFVVGDKFESYDEFEKKLEEYQQLVLHHFWVRDCRTLKTQARRFPDSPVAQANPKLVYYYVRIACIKGGRMHVPKNKIKKTYTFKQNCRAGMFLKLSVCTKYIEIRELNEGHNHDTSEALFHSLPQQRLNLPSSLKRKCQEALKMKGNTKLIQHEILQESGRLVTLKDLSNLKRKPGKRKNREERVTILRDKSDVQILAATSDSNSDIDLYNKLLSNYAFQHVNNQIKLASTCKNLQIIEKDKCLAPTPEGLLQVSVNSCECLFWTYMGLPCRHIFTYRSLKNLPLFDEQLCLKRWTCKNFPDHQLFDAAWDPESNYETNKDININVIDASVAKHEPITNHQKFKFMHDECLKLSQVCSKVSSNIFYERLQFIKSLISKWSQNEEPSINDLNITSLNKDVIESSSTSVIFSHNNSNISLSTPNALPACQNVKDKSNLTNDFFKNLITEHSYSLPCTSENSENIKISKI